MAGSEYRRPHIDRYAAARSGHQPDDGLYLVRRRQRRDPAACFS